MDNSLQNAYMVTLFGRFGTKRLSNKGKLVLNIYENPNSPRAEKNFFPNLYEVYNLYILTDFYLVLLRRVCTRSSRPHGCSVKCPLEKELVLCVSQKSQSTSSFGRIFLVRFLRFSWFQRELSEGFKNAVCLKTCIVFLISIKSILKLAQLVVFVYHIEHFIVYVKIKV